MADRQDGRKLGIEEQFSSLTFLLLEISSLSGRNKKVLHIGKDQLSESAQTEMNSFFFMKSQGNEVLCRGGHALLFSCQNQLGDKYKKGNGELCRGGHALLFFVFLIRIICQNQLRKIFKNCS